MPSRPPVSVLLARLVLLHIALFAAVSARGADWLIKWPQSVGADEREISVWLYATNPGESEETITFPDELTGSIGDGESIGFRPDARGENVVVRPGAFRRLEYRASIEGLSPGPQPLAIDGHGSVILEIQAADIDAPPAAPASRFQRFFSRLRYDQGMDLDASDDLLFGQRIMPYEPIYFVFGEDPSGRFQISFKYWLLDIERVLPAALPFRGRFNLGYSQTSFWDLNSPSAPFLDSSYRPELQFENRNLFRRDDHWLSRVGFETGFQHESNGRDGNDSRSLNIAYLRPTIVFGDEDDFHLTLQPRVWTYVGDMNDNPDMRDYRGHFDLRAKLGWTRGLELAGHLRSGDHLENHSALIELSYPMHELLNDSFPVYLFAQYFTGYGESLLYYNERSEAFRIGIALYR